MKIIHITQFLGIGGLEKIILNLILEQKKLGHEVNLYVYDHQREWVEYFLKQGITVITPPIKSPGIDFKLFLNFNRDLMDADILHGHDMNPLVYLIPLIKMRRLFCLKTPKYIHTTHGMAHIERVPNYRYFEKYFTPLSDKIICVSKKLELIYRNELKVKTRNLVTIENGIQTFDEVINEKVKKERRDFLIKKHHLKKNLPILVCVSRVLKLKNQLFLIESAKQNKNWQLLIVGPASDEVYNNLLLKEKSDNVYLVGAQEDIISYNLGADLFVTASTHEGIPVAVLEAMSVETPVVASNIPGHATLNQHGECINLFQENNRQEFENLCHQLIQNKNESQTKNARKAVENFYSLKNMVSLYIKEYLND